MKIFILFFIVVLSISFNPVRQNNVAIDQKIKAVTIHCKNRPNEATWNQFKEAGITHVVLVPKATIYDYPNSVRLTDVGDSPYWSESVKGIRDAAITAPKYGIQVIVKLHLYPKESVTAKGGLEKIPYSESLGVQYSNVVIRYAKRCQDLKVPIFVICNEATKFYKETEYWIALIKEVRKVYSGKITVGACASNVEDVNFWDRLDYVGISAYYRVSDYKNPTEQEMKIGWNLAKQTVSEISARYNKPVLFTEFGCNASESCAMLPWEWQKNLKEAKKNYVLQTSYYSTMFDAFWKEKWFAGVCIWQTYSLSEIGTQENLGTPQGHEAWKVLKSF
jgi:hypothetical protein